tara:strand:- start:1299 stop:1517 length:219 start_codon:yes stop_codon:yes gene_type:complete
MQALKEKLSNIKKQSFVIEIEEGIEEMLFWYDKKDHCISVSNRCHFASGDHYELDNIDEIIRLYSEFSHLIK